MKHSNITPTPTEKRKREHIPSSYCGARKTLTPNQKKYRKEKNRPKSAYKTSYRNRRHNAAMNEKGNVHEMWALLKEYS